MLWQHELSYAGHHAYLGKPLCSGNINVLILAGMDALVTQVLCSGETKICPDRQHAFSERTLPSKLSFDSKLKA